MKGVRKHDRSSDSIILLEDNVKDNTDIIWYSE